MIGEPEGIESALRLMIQWLDHTEIIEKVTKKNYQRDMAYGSSD